MIILREMLRLITRDKLSVFLFHKVPPTHDPLLPNDLDASGFERVLNFICAHFSVMPLGEAVKRLQSNTLPRGTAAITFDDGYAEWRSGIATTLEKKSLPATMFITTGQLFGTPMWHERLANILRQHKGDVLDTTSVRLPPINTSSPQNRVTSLQALEFHFKYLPLVVRDRFLEQLEQQVGATASDVATMTTDDLVAISNRGFEIGAHTLDHPILGLCDTAIAVDEIGKTREILEGIIKRPVRSFAYPNGRPGIDFSHRHVEMVKSAGYDYAVTTQWGVARPNTSSYQIPRFTPWGPSRRLMYLQLTRNVFTQPESIQEGRR
jgi:peptidoglycan/xylan/chitin deacetylase (PgdA/CDA1 family)